MNAFARLLYLFVAATLPAAFGLLVTGIMTLSGLNDIQTRNIADPEVIHAKMHAAYAPGMLGLEISLPLWIAWAIYLLFQGEKPKQ